LRIRYDQAPHHLITFSLFGTIGSLSTIADENQDIEGFTEPYADIELAASEMGILSSVSVKEGDAVQAVQLLASLDDTVLQAALKIAAASKNARGPLDSATADLETRETELRKLQELRSRNRASQKEVDRVSGEVRMGKARVQAAREELEIKRLEFQRIQAQLNRRQIRSTIDGVVTELYRDHGEFVSPSQPTVARVVQLNPLRIIFSVPIDRRSEIAKGQTVPLSIGSGTLPAEALVEFVSPTADASSGTFRVKVRLPNPQGQWQAGDRSVLLLDSPTTETPQRLARRLR
jgi:RND family efflux transporter MFP subunit